MYYVLKGPGTRNGDFLKEQSSSAHVASVLLLHHSLRGHDRPRAEKHVWQPTSTVLQHSSSRNELSSTVHVDVLRALLEEHNYNSLLQLLPMRAAAVGSRPRVVALEELCRAQAVVSGKSRLGTSDLHIPRDGRRLARDP